eukprot:1159911-Pelagomonas_calceolata.AAC.24
MSVQFLSWLHMHEWCRRLQPGALHQVSDNQATAAKSIASSLRQPSVLRQGHHSQVQTAKRDG